MKWLEDLRQRALSNLQEDRSFRNQLVLWWASLSPIKAVLVLIIVLMMTVLASKVSTSDGRLFGDGSLPSLEARGR